MDLFFLILGGILIITGIIGCFLPVVPGPFLSWLGMLAMELTSYSPFELSTIIWFLFFTIIVSLADNFIPVITTRYGGGSKWGTRGSIAGLIIGIFAFPPFGVLLGPFLGAIGGEILAGKDLNQSLKSGFAAFLGVIGGIVIRLILSITVAVVFIKELVKIL
ncbi:MAG: DUF456 domain-containing protein [Candidatus Kapaibacterium sp.]